MYGTRSRITMYGKRPYGGGLPKYKLYRATGVRTAFRGNGSPTRTQTNTKRRTITASATDNYDKSVRYVRKRMPSLKRRKWVSFSRKVQHVNLQMNPLRIYQSVEKGVNSGAIGEQSSQGTLLYDDFLSNADTLNIFKDAYGGAAAPTDYLARRVYLKSASLDLQFQNTGSVAAIVDVYQIRIRRGTVTTYNTLLDMWNDTFAEMATVGIVGAANPQMTPFDNPNFCKHWLVVKKTEFVLDASKIITMNIRKPKNGFINGRNLEQSRSGLVGWTEGFFWQIRGAPANNASSSGLASHTVTYGVQKSYHYAYPPGIDPQETIGQTK